MVARRWQGQQDLYLDVVGSSPLTADRLPRFLPGLAARGAADEKRRKYSQALAALQGDVVFLPFSFDTFGGLEGSALVFLRQLQDLFRLDRGGEEERDDRGTQSVMVRISYAIAFEVGVSLADRFRRAVDDIHVHDLFI